jgi:hypothetical protein
MIRRHIKLIVLATAAFALAACASPTAPKADQSCGVNAGSGFCSGS